MAQSHAFFQHAEHINIGDSHMEMRINHHHAQMDEQKRLMSILANQCTLTAQFDSKERYRPPRCAELTRENILKKLRNWVEANSFASSLFWLHGGAGAGKSAIAQSLAEESKEGGSLAASFFFFSIEASRNNGDRLLPTIIYQLTRIHSTYEKKVIEQLKRNQDIFNRPLEQQMKVLFTDPLMALHEEGVDPSTFPRLIVIDGLDECRDTETQCHILAIVVQTILAGLPYPFRFLVTSRPEGHINRIFDNNRWIKQIPVQKYDLSKDSDASEDIHTFLQQEFKRIYEVHALGPTLKSSGWPSEEMLTALTDRSSGHFVFPAMAIRYIDSPKHRPDDRLEIFLDPSPNWPEDKAFSQLDAMFMLILNDIDGSKLLDIKRALSILYLISEKIGYFATYHCSSSRIIQDMLLLRPGELDLWFDPLNSLVARECEDGHLHVYHKVIFDFLLNPKRGQKFAFNKALCHESVVLYMHNMGSILTNWTYAPDFMYFAYHCYLAQPIEDERLIRFLENLNILYTTDPAAYANENSSQPLYQNRRPLLLMFLDEGEQAPGAKTIFYILRMLSLLRGFREGQDLHEIHSLKISQFYARITAHGSREQNNSAQLNGNENGTSEPSSVSAPTSEDVSYQPDLHAALDEMIRTKLTLWQPSEDTFGAITADDGPISTDARDILIKREHVVFTSFARAQHLPNSDYRQQSTLLLSDSKPSEANSMVAHSYHFFSVDYENEPNLVILVGTYSRGGLRLVAKDSDGAGAGAVCSADWFDITLLDKKTFEEKIGKFLNDHILKVEKELAQVIDDGFAAKFKF